MWVRDSQGDLLNMNGADAVFIRFQKPATGVRGGYIVYMQRMGRMYPLTRPLDEAKAEQVVKKIEDWLSITQMILVV